MDLHVIFWKGVKGNQHFMKPVLTSPLNPLLTPEPIGPLFFTVHKGNCFLSQYPHCISAAGNSSWHFKVILSPAKQRPPLLSTTLLFFFINCLMHLPNTNNRWINSPTANNHWPVEYCFNYHSIRWTLTLVMNVKVDLPEGEKTCSSLKSCSGSKMWLRPGIDLRQPIVSAS